MRILFLSHLWWSFDRHRNVGGMQRVAAELQHELGSHPEVVLHSLVLHSSWRANHLRFLPFLGTLLYRIPRLIDEHRIEAILFAGLGTATLAPLLRARCTERGVVLAALAYGLDVVLPNRLYQLYLPRVFGALDLVLPISRATAERCLERGSDASRVHVVPVGVDAPRFASILSRAEARRRLEQAAWAPDAAPADTFLLCSVGRLIERKGVLWFIERVMPLLPPRVRYWIVGEGPMEPAIRAAIERLGLGARVRLLGALPDSAVIELLQGADLFVMPNIAVADDMEGFGLVLLEAGACGLPVLAARLDGVQDAVCEGVTGHLLPSGEPARWAACIQHCLDALDQVGGLRSGAADLIRTRFAWPRIVEQYLRLLRQSGGRCAP
jgi:phosphatidyl-myo-inositol dimannoside synthase